jgi:hypothetical protein
LHYYFKDKEYVVSKALTSSTGNMIQSSPEWLKGTSAEETADNIINMHNVT